MNPLPVESSLIAALTPFFPGVTIAPGVAYGTLSAESLNVVAFCPKVTHQCGPLYYAECTLRMEGPALYGQKIFESLEAAMASFESALSSPDFAAGWPSGSPSFCGLYVHEVTNSSHGDLWDVEIALRVGIAI